MNTTNPFKKNRPFVLGVVFTVIEGFLSASVYMSLYLLILMLLADNVTWDNLLRLTALIAGIFLVRLVAYAFGYTQGQIGGGAVSRQIRLFLGDKFKRIPLARFTQGQIGQYVNVMTSDVSGYEQILTHKIGSLVKNISLSAMLLLFVCVSYLPAGAILLAVSLLFVPNLALSFRIVKKYGRSRNAICAEAVSSIVEYISGIQTLRAYNMCGAKNRTTTDVLKQYSDVSYKYEAKGIPVAFTFNILTWLSLPAVMLVASRPWLAGTLASVDYLMVCMMPMLLAKLYMAISIDLIGYKNMLISKGKIMAVMGEPEETGSNLPLDTATHEIVFEAVDFAYVQGEPVLAGASFTVPDQKLTAIVGDSGSGKSTILNLIAKYYEPTAGSIRIGGQAIGAVAAEQVLAQISMVDQDVFLFDDTVRENIRHARPDATDAEIEAACRAANCDGFIRKLAKGYDTEIGENGNLLSGGERQRLSIARAILKNAPILLLDEATASLDIENELAVKQAIANLLSEQKTVVMIAHTLSIVKNADQILVVGDGHIIESGSHEGLLAKGGKYAAMWQAEQKLSA
ncbi:MAG: ABC transporter ATP-binding protein [Peptococcaceae bacterium]|nr:ABC transporter ATP-binding protein [Peptococcaceae bacterium]